MRICFILFYLLFSIFTVFCYTQQRVIINIDILKHLFFAAFVISAYNAGAFIVSFFDFLKKENAWTKLVLGCGIGFIAISIPAWILLFAKTATVISYSVIIIIPLMAQLFFVDKKEKRVEFINLNFAVQLFQEVKNGIQESVKKGFAAIFFDAFIISLMIFALIFSTLPQTAWDALAYHLEIPKHYAAAHQVVFTSDNYFWGFPQSISIMYSIFILFGYDTLSSSFHCLFLLMSAVFILNFSFKDSWENQFGCLARKTLALLMLAHPDTLSLCARAYVDLPLVYYFLISSLMLLSAQITLAAIFLAGAMGCKYTGLVMAVIFAAALLYSETESCVKRRFKNALNLILISSVIFLPNLIKNFIFTGNPLYPFFKNFFPTETFECEILEWYYEVISHVGKPKSIVNLLSFPFDITVYSQYEGIQNYSGVLGVTFFLLIPFFIYGFMLCRKSHDKIMRNSANVSFFIFGFFYLFILNAQATRYFLPVFPVFLFPAIIGLKKFYIQLSHWQKHTAVMASAAMLFICASPAFLEFANFEPIRYLCGLETKRDYLNRNLKMLACVEKYNKIAMENNNQTKLAALHEPRMYYFKNKYIWKDFYEPTVFQKLIDFDNSRQILNNPEGMDKLAANFKKNQITHILISEIAFKLFMDFLETDDCQKVFIKFINEKTACIESKNGYALYSLK